VTITHKVIWCLGLVAVLLFVFFTGQANRVNFAHVQQSIEEIYEDRLVVKGLIFEMSNILHRKEVAAIEEDQAYFAQLNDSVNAQLDAALRAFEATRLTSQEEGTLTSFSEGVARLKELERRLGLADEQEVSAEGMKRLRDLHDVLGEQLEALSKIQLSEGRRKLRLSVRAVDSMNVFFRIENIMLVAFFVLMVAIVFVVPGPKPA